MVEEQLVVLLSSQVLKRLDPPSELVLAMESHTVLYLHKELILLCFSKGVGVNTMMEHHRSQQKLCVISTNEPNT